MRAEVDGPPTAWFDIGTKRFHYITYAAYSKECGKLLAGLMLHLKEVESAGAIVWRLRPRIEQDTDCPGEWRITYRMIVVPFEDFLSFGSVTIPSKAEGAAIIHLD